VVALNQIGTLSQTTAPTAIQHVSRLRSVTINASDAAGKSVGAVQSAVQASVAKIALPPGFTVSYAGQAQQGTSAFTDIFKALGVSVVLMYMLMMLLFRSVTLSIAVLMSLPLAVVGAIGGMTLTGSNSPFSRCWASPCWLDWLVRMPSCWWTTRTHSVGTARVVPTHYCTLVPCDCGRAR
jgi:HAE1 family hydrophobic/amphiphilic exporter-1